MASIQDDRGYNQGFKPTFALKIRTERRCERILSQIAEGSQKVVVELGCGTGELSYELSKKINGRIVGIDICEPFIDQARKSYQKENLQYMVKHLGKSSWIEEIARKDVDYIVGNGILHHLYYKLDEFLPQMRMNLAPSGKIIFWEPNLLNPYVYLIFTFPFLRKVAKLEPDEMAFSANFIAKKLSEAGFKKVNVEYRDFLLPNIPTILVPTVIFLGDIFERIFPFKLLSQSLFITAEVE